VELCLFHRDSQGHDFGKLKPGLLCALRLAFLPWSLIALIRRRCALSGDACPV